MLHVPCPMYHILCMISPGGGLGSRVRLHLDRHLNHNFDVWRGVMTQECIQRLGAEEQPPPQQQHTDIHHTHSQTQTKMDNTATSASASIDNTGIS